MSRILLTIENNLYDASEFSNIHPGGKRILEMNNGQDATENFYKFKHTNQAISIMKTLAVKPSVKPSNNQPIVSTKWSKLFTQEDKYFYHKILGLTCLISFLYRYYLGFLGERVFDSSYMSLFTAIIHLCLNITSFIFHIPKERIPEKPMIWKEFRIHNLLFVTRSCLAMISNWFYTKSLISKKNLLTFKIGLIFSIMILADITTYFFRDSLKKESTTRTMPYWKECSSIREKIHKFYYAVSQFEATMACFSDEIHTPFFMLMPIQLSSFLMTLVRKNVISNKLWHELYFTSLFIPDILYIRNAIFVFQVFPLSIICTWLRMEGIPKYAIWYMIALSIWMMSF